MSLIRIAKSGDPLPKVQHMDKETLDWIRLNKPKFKTVLSDKIIHDDCYRISSSYIPRKVWFSDAKKTDTIHGMRHILRVTIHAINLALLCSLDDQQLKNVCIAANLHDIRRLNDKGDENHGLRTADWFKSNLVDIKKHYKISFSGKDAEAIYSAIFFHEVPYTDLERKENYKKHKKIVDILKSADALDRYRLPKLKWWIDCEYLKLCPSDLIKCFAYELVIKSEAYFLKGQESQQSVIQSVKELCRYYASQ